MSRFDEQKAPRRLQLLTTTLAALMLAQALMGLLFQGQYRDVEWIKATWFGNDWVTLVIAVPLLVRGFVLGSRGSVPGLLLWLGIIGYAVYNYAYYLLGAALNAFFPLYVAALVLAALTLILALTQVDVGNVARGFRPTTPVRMIGGYLAFVGVGLASIWIAMWAAYVFAGQPTPIEPEAFKLVAALDISLMAPALMFGGILLWRQHSWGYIVGAIAGIQGALYLLVLAVNSVVAIQRDLAQAPGELPIWGTLAIFTSAVTVLLLANTPRGRSSAALFRPDHRGARR